jgi:hypothetical protein
LLIKKRVIKITLQLTTSQTALPIVEPTAILATLVFTKRHDATSQKEVVLTIIDAYTLKLNQ